MNKSIWIAVVLLGFISLCSPALAYSWDGTRFYTSGNPYYPTSMTMNATYFWIADSDPSAGIYRFNMSGIYNSSSFGISSKCHRIASLTMNATYFWISCEENSTDEHDARVYRYTIAGAYSGNFSISSQFDFQEIAGMTSNNTYLWIVNNNDNYVHRYYLNGTYSGNFSTAGEMTWPWAITFNNTYFWIKDMTCNGNLYGYDSTGAYNNSASTLEVEGCNGWPIAISTNNTYLWVLNGQYARVDRFVNYNYVVNTFDEETGSAIASWNIYNYNGTKSDTLASITNAPYNYSGYWMGTNILSQVSKTGYATRNFYVTIANESTYYLLNAYLLNSTNGNFVRLHVYDSFSNPLPNSTVIATRYISGAWTKVEHTISDSSGTATMFMSPITSYNFNVTNPNCTGKTFNLMPTSTDYSVQLSCGGTGNFTNTTSPSVNLTINISPVGTSLCNNTTTFRFNITDLNGWLSQYGVNITNSTGSVLWSAQGTNNNGTNLSSAINLANQSGQLIMIYNFTRTPYSVSYNQKNYFVSPYNCAITPANYSLQYTVNQINSGYFGIPPIILLVIALLVSISAVGISSYLGTGGLGGSLVFLSVFALFSYIFNLFNIFSWNMFLLSILGAVAVIVIMKFNG